MTTGHWSIIADLSYPGSEVPLQRRHSKGSEEREPLVTCSEAFRGVQGGGGIISQLVKDLHQV